MSLATRSLVFLLAVCVCFGYFAHGGTFSMPVPENPAFPGMCYEPRLKRAFAVDESFTEHPGCTRMTCFKSNSKPPVFSFHGATCSYPSRLPANCQDVPGDPTADYPACCSDAKCDGPPQGSIKYIG